MKSIRSRWLFLYGPQFIFRVKYLKMFLSLKVLLLSLVSAVSAAPLQRRDVIAHDAVVGFTQTVPSGTLGQLYLKYKPYLYVVNGCVPFPAVDAEGNVS